MKRNAYLLLIIILLFSACKEPKVENINIKEAVDSHILAMKNEKSDSLKFELCSFIPLKWDSLVVVTGYATPQTLDGFKFENQHVLGQFINTVPEHSFVLLYIKNNRIVGYSDLLTPLLDFRRISNHYHQGFTIMYEKECNSLMTKRFIKNGQMDYHLISTSNK